MTKKLTGVTKLAKAAQDKSLEENQPTTNELKGRQKPRLKNFRLTGVDIMRLQKLTEALNEGSERQISETAVIKGLIVLGEKTNTEKLLKMIREAW